MFKSIRNMMVSLLSGAILVAVPLAVPALATADTPNITGSLCTSTNSLQVSTTGGGDCPSETTNGTAKAGPSRAVATRGRCRR